MGIPNFHEEDETGIMRQKDTESKALMKSYAGFCRKVTKNKIEIGDNVVICQRKMNKFNPLYSAVTLTVTDKHSMITAENVPMRLTKIASFFKKVHPDTAMPDSKDPPPADDVDPPLNDTGYSTSRQLGRVIFASK